jgi:hypothetical protein
MNKPIQKYADVLRSAPSLGSRVSVSRLVVPGISGGEHKKPA